MRWLTVQVVWLLIAPSAAFSRPSPWCSRLRPVAISRARIALAGTTNGIEAANRCRLLPDDAGEATILHVDDSGALPPPKLNEVQILINDGSLALSVVPAAAALRSGPRRLINEMGKPHTIRLHSGGVRGLQLRRAYGNAPIERAADSAEASPSLQGPQHRCDVVFARRSLAERASVACAGAVRVARRVPLLGGAVRAALAGVADGLVWQLTPTFEPTITLRMLKRLPWRCQRLGARLWLQAMLHAEDRQYEQEQEQEQEQEEQEEAEAGRRHPFELVHTLPMLGPAECDAAIEEAEAYATQQGGWLTDRHVAYPTTDIPISKLPRLEAMWEQRLFPSVAQAFQESLGLPQGSVVTPLDVFVVKYDQAGQTELAVHRDNGLLTFSMLLNEPEAFEGGGTYFERCGRVYRPSRGVGVLHSALVRHAGYPISGGTRYVLVGFCGLRSPRLPRGFGSWRFGEPPWYVTSRVVSDRQILQRVWPLTEAGAARLEQEERCTEEGFDDDDDDFEEDLDAYPTLEELLERGEISAADFEEMSGAGAGPRASTSAFADGVDVGVRVRTEFGDGVVRFRGVDVAFSEGDWVGIELDAPEGRNSGSVQGVRYFACRPNHGLFAPRDKVELIQPAASDEVESSPSRQGEVADAAETEAKASKRGRGEKPWYRKQHEQAARARREGRLLKRAAAPGAGPDGGTAGSFELWQQGDDLVALHVAAAPRDVADAPAAEPSVVGSVVYRDGPVTPDMRELLFRLLPSRRNVLRRLRPVRLAGMVHVYVEPAWRGNAHGEALARFSMRAVRGQGFSHVLTLADDRGSGQLIDWYSGLGFVEAHQIDAPGETAMVARAA